MSAHASRFRAPNAPYRLHRARGAAASARDRFRPHRTWLLLARPGPGQVGEAGRGREGAEDPLAVVVAQEEAPGQDARGLQVRLAEAAEEVDRVGAQEGLRHPAPRPPEVLQEA